MTAAVRTDAAEALAQAALSAAVVREGLAVFDEALRLRACNARFAALGGYPDSLCRPGTPCAALVRFGAERAEARGGDVEAAAADRMACLDEGRPVSFEERRSDGTVLSVNLAPMPGGGALMSILDVTRAADAERALAETKELLRVLTDEAPVLLNLADAEGQLTYVNRRNVDFSERPIEEILGCGWEVDIHPDDLPAIRQVLQEASRLRKPYEIEYRMRRHDGVYRHMREIGVARFAPDGTFLGHVGANEDITDAKAVKQELARQREALHQSEKMSALGSLLAGVAHELNNPLSIVVGQAQLLQEEAADARTAERAEMIGAAAERCAKIVKTFLAMARRRPPERSSVSLNAVVESSLGVVGYGLRSAGIEVATDLAPDLPCTLADGDQLQQVVTNLVINAQQALEGRDGARRLSLTTRFEAAAGELRLEVADTGPGVPPAIRSRIFEPFFTTKSAGAGTGVGLSLCHGIIGSHGGTITVEDAPGGGARFVVRLPYVPPGAPEAATSALALAAAGPAAPAILIVDDEAAIARTLADMLADAGHRVDVAAGGRAALACIDRQDYGLVLSDLRMPDLDGPALYRALVERDPGWHDRIIFLTGDTLSDAALAFLGRTKRPCIEKPFSRQEVRRVVAEALASAHADGAASVTGP